MAENDGIEDIGGDGMGDTPQDRVDMANTEAIQKLTDAVEKLTETTSVETRRAKAAEASVLQTAKEHADRSVSDAVNGVVRTVNGNAPTEDGDVSIDHVERADEIVCRTVSVYSDKGFSCRISGVASGTRPSHVSITKIYGRTESVGGLLMSTRALSFRTTGFNWFNPDDVVDGCSIPNDGGGLEKSSIGRVAFVRVVKTEGGYAVHHAAGAVVRCAMYHGDEQPTFGSEVTVIGLTHSAKSDFASGDVNDFYDIDEDGWLCVELSGHEPHLCVHPILGGKETWNRMGYRDYEDYEEHSVVFPTVAPDGGSVPNGVFGLASVELEDGTTLRDEYDVVSGTIRRNVGRMDYSQSNLDDVKAWGVAYRTDDRESIYYELRSEDVYSTTVSPIVGDIPTCPFGRETMEFESLPPPCVAEYVEDLAGKLSDDVLTVSDQQLTDAEKDQVNANIGTRYSLNPIQLKPDVVMMVGSETDVLSCEVKDRAVNSFDVKTVEKPVVVRLPAKPVDGRARDFIVRMSVWTQKDPSVMFKAPDGEENEYESVDSSWEKVKPGINLFSFTEVQ